MAAFTNTNAADVRPSIWCLECRMVPAPIKPTPDTTCAAIRVGSPVDVNMDTCVNTQDPKQIRTLVLIPAGFPNDSRSRPMQYPHVIASNILIKYISQPSSFVKNSTCLLYQIGYNRHSPILRFPTVLCVSVIQRRAESTTSAFLQVLLFHFLPINMV
jgi:hypothetical protein